MLERVCSNSKLTVWLAVFAATGIALTNVQAGFYATVAFTLILFVVLLVGAAQNHLSLSGIAISIILSSVPLLFFLHAQHSQRLPPASDLSTYCGRQVIFTACVSDQLPTYKAGQPFVVDVDELIFPDRKRLSGQAMVSGMCDSSTINGKERTRLRIRAFIKAPASAKQPWEFDQRRYLYSQRIYCLCCPVHSKGGDDRADAPFIQILPALPLARQGSRAAISFNDIAGWFDSVTDRARSLIVAAHRQCLPVAQADLLSSMVLGNRAVSLDEKTTIGFRDVGLSHILAASGFNLTIVTAMSFWLCRLVSPSILVSNCLSLTAMLAFVALAGLSPSVFRAALMCSLLIFSNSSKRTSQIVSSLAAAFLITVVLDPLAVNDIGMQLSYAATIGIVGGAKAFSELIYGGTSRLGRWSAESISVVLIAQSSVIPIQLFRFWQVGALFLPANLLIAPLVTPITVLGFASSILALLQVMPLSQFLVKIVDTIVAIPLHLSLWMVEYLSSFDQAKIPFGQPALLNIAAYYFGFVCFIAACRTKRLIALATGLFLVGAVCLVWRTDTTKLTVALIRGRLILIDDRHRATGVGQERATDKWMPKFLAFNAAKAGSSQIIVKDGAHASYIASAVSAQQQWQIVISDCCTVGRDSQGEPRFTLAAASGRILVLQFLKRGSCNFDSTKIRTLFQDGKPAVVIVFCRAGSIKAFDQALDEPNGAFVDYVRHCQLPDDQVKMMSSGDVNAIMLYRRTE